MSDANEKRILITGFGAFPKQDINPSAALVQSLSQHFQSCSNVKCLVLPTEYRQGLSLFRDALNTFQPDVVLCFGVAARRHKINLETIAKNERSTTSLDAVGYKPLSSIISNTGRARYKATLPLAALKNELSAQGLPTRLSRDAGNYLCNFTFYHLMKHIAENAPHIEGGFIHIPDPAKGKILPEQLERAGQIIVQKMML